MASGHINKRGDKWRARYRGTDGKERSRTFDTKREANSWLSQQTSSIVRGDWIDPKAGEIKFGEYARGWLDRQTFDKPKTEAETRGLLASRVLPEWQDVSLNKISYEAVSSWSASLIGVVSSSRTRQSIHLLGRILDDATRTGRLVRHPVRQVKLPRLRTKRKVVPLTVEQVEKLADACGGRWGTLVRILAYTGMRWGEVVALRPMDFDLKRRRVQVANTLSEVGGHLHETDTKTHRVRSVPLIDELVAEIEWLIEGEEQDALLFTWGTHERPPLSSEFARTVWRPAKEAVGLDSVRVHDLRHTCASLLISKGAPVTVVARILGHSKATTTLSIYAHLFENETDAWGDKLNEDVSDTRAANLRPVEEPPGSSAG
ncbi:site-specific integrase [Embleya sp. NBC_00888]|uniref:tyrosine-type recombinase/integrase n=1 Tax=Embleya sp. NBC_00888 TaxID=2975960 RepID=UPI0038631237|nr:site-specific integrase [Embleya sp. NBC_00888]